MKDNSYVLMTQDVCYSVDSNEILKNINLKIKKGSFYGIVGPNGSGKTTLMDILCGYRKSDSGEKYLLNKNLEEYSKKELAKKIALVPQTFDIPFSFRVNEVIEMGRHPFIKRFASLTEHDYSIIEDVVSQLGLEDFLARDFMTLSGGERQRVIFARALAQNTPILFLDEATSNLDPYYTHSLLSVVKKWVEDKNITVLAVFHELNLASLYCDEIIMIKNGEIFFSGNTRNTLNEDNVSSVFDIETDIIYDSKTEKPFIMTKGINKKGKSNKTGLKALIQK